MPNSALFHVVISLIIFLSLRGKQAASNRHTSRLDCSVLNSVYSARQFISTLPIVLPGINVGRPTGIKRERLKFSLFFPLHPDCRRLCLIATDNAFI